MLSSLYMTSIWTRQELLEEIDLYKRALKACASCSSYTPGSCSLRRQNLQEIRDQLDCLASELAALDGRRGPAIATNGIGCGLVPQSIIPVKALGLELEAVVEIQDRMEWLWSEWCTQALTVISSILKISR